MNIVKAIVLLSLIGISLEANNDPFSLKVTCESWLATNKTTNKSYSGKLNISRGDLKDIPQKVNFHVMLVNSPNTFVMSENFDGNVKNKKQPFKPVRTYDFKDKYGDTVLVFEALRGYTNGYVASDSIDLQMNMKNFINLVAGAHKDYELKKKDPYAESFTSNKQSAYAYPGDDYPVYRGWQISYICTGEVID